jgi:hypothetical protein
MWRLKPPPLDTSGEVKGCAVFEVSESYLPDEAHRHKRTNQPFRDPAALVVLQKIASGLRQQGYETTEPKHGKACDAILRCEFENFGITTIINVECRQEDVIRFRLLTWMTRGLLSRLLYRERPPSPEIKDQWNRLCSVIGQQLGEITGGRSALWLTRNQAERDWSQRGGVAHPSDSE